MDPVMRRGDNGERITVFSQLSNQLQASQNFKLPIISYQVSGEYAMLKHAADKGAFDFDAAMFESLIAFKRAGVSAIISYGAIDAVKKLS
jgi:porphobilinogen synthase